MAYIMRTFAGLSFVLAIATPAVAQVQVEAVKPLPAWCGGSYSITGGLEPNDYVAALKAGQTATSSGTNFGVCVDIVREVRSLDGTVNAVSIPTYPTSPASQVSVEADGRVLFRTGEVDKDGKAIVEELKLPEIPK